LLAGLAAAQLKDGDLVIGQFNDPTAAARTYGPGSLLSLDPATGKVLTLNARFTSVGTITVGPNWVEMASDNKNLMVAGIPSGATPTALGNGNWFFSVSPQGSIIRTLVSDTATPTTSGHYINAFDLDYDGTWILASGYSLFAFNETTMSYGTLWTAGTAAGTHNAFVIDRALGGPEYVVGQFNISTSTNACLMGVDRKGHVASISVGGPSYVSGIKIDRVTGDYISSGFGIAGTGSGGEYMRTTKKGVLQTLNAPTTATTMYRANGIYIDQQHLAYILTYDWQTQPVPTVANNYVCSVYKMDLQGVYITQYVFGSTLTRAIFAPAGITEYGSRHVTCLGSGKPGTAVTVRFSSRRPGDAGKAYQLAAAYSYTSGIRMPNGQYLDLALDSLFVLTAQNALPFIFQNFAGVLDASGNATAKVAIPASMPPGLKMPVFVSGLVIDPGVPGGISSVGNTHWFVLN
jgi:hypothetical protein